MDGQAILAPPAVAGGGRNLGDFDPRMLLRLPTAGLAAAGLIAGFGAADTTGSRPLGGAVLAVFGLACIAIWLRRDGRSTALRLTGAGLLAFAASHALGLLIGAWPAVLVTAAATAVLCWQVSDGKLLTRRSRIL